MLSGQDRALKLRGPGRRSRKLKRNEERVEGKNGTKRMKEKEDEDKEKEVKRRSESRGNKRRRSKRKRKKEKEKEKKKITKYDVRCNFRANIWHINKRAVNWASSDLESYIATNRRSGNFFFF